MKQPHRTHPTTTPRSPAHHPAAALALAVASLLAGAPAWAQTVFSTPGSHTFSVPPGTGSLQVVVKGAAGGSGGWDDAIGGNGVGGSIVIATVAVAGGETVDILVGEGGEGTLGPPKTGMRGRAAFSSGGAGGGDGFSQNAGAVTAPLPGAGGRGGDSGTLGSSPGGAGGGGASALGVAGAVIAAGGGGGGGTNSRIYDNAWQIPGAAAVNNLVLNQQDAACIVPAVGGNGVDGAAVDGAGGSGGGGGYGSHAGAGGAAGRDGNVLGGGANGAPGGSGASCTLDAGTYRITGTSMALGTPTLPASTKGVPNPSGENGSVTITAIPAPPNTAPTASPVLTGTALVGLAVSGSYSFADTEADAENATATGTRYALVRSAATGLTAAAQGTVLQSGASMGAAVPLAYTLVAADEAQYLYYCVTPVAATGANPGAEVCSAALGPVAGPRVVTPPVVATPAPVPALAGWGLLLASASLGGLGAWRARRSRKLAALHR